MRTAHTPDPWCCCLVLFVLSLGVTFPTWALHGVIGTCQSRVELAGLFPARMRTARTLPLMLLSCLDLL
jgi:hypothetical protein